jgi:hypothetical protein
MSGRKPTLFVALFAVVLNLVGTSMAWARMSANLDHTPSPAMSGTEHCAGHVDAGESNEDDTAKSTHSSCCSGGGCSCACLPVATVVTHLQTTTMAPVVVASESGQAHPADPFEDTLRPPIS